MSRNIQPIHDEGMPAVKECSIRPARASDAADLSRLAIRSKAHWGYPRAFMRACRDELTFTLAQIDAEHRHVVVAERAGRPVGFSVHRPLRTPLQERVCV